VDERTTTGRVASGPTARDWLCREAGVAFADLGDEVVRHPTAEHDAYRAAVGEALMLAGELVRACVVLLAAGRQAAVLPLLRQLAEVEHLVGWFAQDRDAALWWRSASPDELAARLDPDAMARRIVTGWSPEEYGVHLVLGGQPGPAARRFLPGQADDVSGGALEDDLAQHCAVIWSAALVVLDGQPWSRDLAGIARRGMGQALEAWRSYGSQVPSLAWASTPPVPQPPRRGRQRWWRRR